MAPPAAPKVPWSAADEALLRRICHAHPTSTLNSRMRKFNRLAATERNLGGVKYKVGALGLSGNRGRNKSATKTAAKAESSVNPHSTSTPPPDSTPSLHSNMSDETSAPGSSDEVERPDEPAILPNSSQMINSSDTTAPSPSTSHAPPQPSHPAPAATRRPASPKPTRPRSLKPVLPPALSFASDNEEAKEYAHRELLIFHLGKQVEADERRAAARRAQGEESAAASGGK